MKTETQWLKPRHKIVRDVLCAILTPYTRWKYGIDVQPFKEQGDRQYLILMNHQTGFDQFFVGMCFQGPVYYLATEDIFSLGWVSDLIRWLVEPIPIKKQTTDIQAIKNCIKVAREGGTIAIAPEGNRTFHGKLAYIKPSIASLAKKLKMPIALFRIEDGYGIQPRWSDVVRKGKMRAYVSQVIEPEEYSSMSNEELAARIQAGLDVDEACVTGSFTHKKSAEYLERVVYVCPDCGLSEFESHGQTIHCKKCGMQIRYTPTKELEGVDKPFPHRFIADWYEAQNAFINQLDVLQLCEKPVYTDTVRLSEVIIRKRKNLLRKHACAKLYGDRVVIDEDLVMPFQEISTLTVLGKNKINIYHNDMVYQIKGNKRFNALRYVNFYFRYKNLTEGNQDGEFLGI